MSSTEDPPIGSRRRLLLVEDDPDDAELTRLLLREKGDVWDVEVADTVASAVQRLRKGGIEAVLMDLGLPDASGVKAVAQIVSQAAGVPVIVLSGSGHDERIAEEARKAGAYACLVKGKVEVAQLRGLLREATGRPRDP